MVIGQLERLAAVGAEWILYLLILLSVVSIGIMVERWVFFLRHRGDAMALGDELLTKLRRGDRSGADALLSNSTMLEAQVMRPALSWMDGGADAFAEIIDAELGKKRRELEKGMNYLGTLGNNAPFIGLLGTVLGVIEAFRALGGGAGQSDAVMGNVMSGIAEALIATGVGLLVALPAVVAFNIAQKKIGDIEGNIAVLAKQVIALLKSETGARSSRVPGEVSADAKDDADSVPERIVTTNGQVAAGAL